MPSCTIGINIVFMTVYTSLLWLLYTKMSPLWTGDLSWATHALNSLHFGSKVMLWVAMLS